MNEPSVPKSQTILAAGYVAGNLDPEEAREFEVLLAENPELLAEVERLQKIQEQLFYGLNEVKPPEHLRSSILQAANNSIKNNSTSKRNFWQWDKIMGSFAALLILYLGVDNYYLRQNLNIAEDTNTLLQNSQTRLFSLKGMNVANTASGSFVMNLEKQKGIIAIQHLSAAPVGYVYRVWVVADGEKIPCGQINTSQKGTVLEKLTMPADFYDAKVSELFVTLEPSSESRYPVGAIVIKSMLSSQ
jgi:anti-sigma-K factor RskA